MGYAHDVPVQSLAPSAARVMRAGPRATRIYHETRQISEHRRKICISKSQSIRAGSHVPAYSIDGLMTARTTALCRGACIHILPAEGAPVVIKITILCGYFARFSPTGIVNQPVLFSEYNSVGARACTAVGPSLNYVLACIRNVEVASRFN